MKKFLIGLGVVFVLLIATISILPFLIPASTYRTVVENQLENSLGRDVTFGKDPKVQIFPQLGVKIDEVTISNADGFADPYFAKADSMSVAVKWLPLLSKRVEIASASFIGMEVLLEEKSNGAANWVFEPKTSDETHDKQSGEPSAVEPGFEAVIPKASLKNSRIRFVSAVNNLNYDVTNINLDASLSGFSGPVSLKGDLTINEEPFNISATLTSLANVMKGENFEVDADIKSAIANASYKGSVMTGETVSLAGIFSAKLDDLSKTFKFANIEMEQSLNEVGSISANGTISGTPDNLYITDISVAQKGPNLSSDFSGEIELQGSKIQPTGSLNAKATNLKELAKGFGTELVGATSKAYESFEAALTVKPYGNGFSADIQSLRFDEIKVTGTANVDLSPKVPRVSANLNIPDLDLSPYLVESEKSKPQQTQQSVSWSEDPIDLSVLKSANGSLKLVIGRVSNARAEILDVSLDSKIQNGTLSGTLVSKSPETGRTSKSNRLNPLYDGSLTTQFSLTSVSKNMNKLSFSAKGSGIAAADLVKFFTGQNVLKGVAGIDTTAKTQGASISDFVKSLSGSYTATVADGAIMGINLPQLLRSARSALTTGELPSALSPEQQTDFSSLNLKGDIASGTANIELFQLLSPFVRADATGTVDLFNQTLDIRITPRTVAAGEQDGQTGVGGFGIPLRVKGSWTNISGSLDMDFLTKLVAEQAKTKAKAEIEKKLGGSLNDFLNKSLGGSDKADDADETGGETNDKKEKSDTEKAKDLLNDLFGKKKE